MFEILKLSNLLIQLIELILFFEFVQT